MIRQGDTVELLNINHPGSSRQIDARLYAAMRDAILKAAPCVEPGVTFADLDNRVRIHLPDNLFPGGAKAGWWLKAVQLDLEARGELIRAKCRPLKFSQKPSRPE